MTRKAIISDIRISPVSARAFFLKKGSTIKIVDIKGGQAGDFVAFKAGDFKVHMSQTRTRVENGKVSVTGGDSIWTNTFPPEVMLVIRRDTAGPHDLLYPPCCRYALKKRFHISRNGCLENLVKALRKWKVKPSEVPDPLNLFFRVSVDRAGRMHVLSPVSQAGSYIEIEAMMDCVVAVSTCSVPVAGRRNSGYMVKIV